MSRPTAGYNLQITKDGDLNFNEPPEVGTINGTGTALDPIRITVGSSSVMNINDVWLIRFNAVFNSAVTQFTSFTDFTSTARYSYTDDTGTYNNIPLSVTRLIRTSTPRIPDFREVSP